MDQEGTKLPAGKLSAEGSELLLSHLLSGLSQQVPLDEIFLALADDSSDRRLQRVARHLSEKLKRGTSLEDALQGISGVLPPQIESALEAGAKSGNLPAMVRGLSESEAARRQMRHGLRSALAYPSLIASALVLLILFLSFVVIPPFREIYEDFQLDFPEATLFTLKLAEHFPTVLLIVAGVAAALAGLGIFAFGRRFFCWFRTSLPIVGAPFTWGGQHEFATLMSSLLQYKVPLGVALTCTSKALRDRNLARSTDAIQQKCQDGCSLGQAMRASLHFDTSLTTLAEWGETHESLPESLAEAARYFEKEMSYYVQFLHRILPPAILVLVLCILLTLVLSLMLPLVTLINGLSG